MNDRKYSASLIVACPGQEEAEVEKCAYGELRSRLGARLKFVTADADLVYEYWSRDIKVSEKLHIRLINPSYQEFASAIKKISSELSAFPQSETGIDLYFAGHGTYGSGALVLKDQALTAGDLIKLVEQYLIPSGGGRGLSMMLDSCYSGAFLFDIIVELQSNKDLVLYEVLCSSMHDEKSHEISFLEHGAFTFTQFHIGNSYVRPNELAKAIDENNHKIIAKCIQGLVATMADPTTYLTQGKQHPISYHSSGYIDAKTRGAISIEDLEKPLDVHKIAAALHESKQS